MIYKKIHQEFITIKKQVSQNTEDIEKLKIKELEKEQIIESQTKLINKLLKELQDKNIIVSEFVID